MEPQPEPEPEAEPEREPEEPDQALPHLPAPPKQKPQGITSQALGKKLAALQHRLSQREAALGHPDNLARNYLELAKKKVSSAETPDERRAAWSTLLEVEQSLR